MKTKLFILAILTFAVLVGYGQQCSDIEIILSGQCPGYFPYEPPGGWPPGQQGPGCPPQGCNLLCNPSFELDPGLYSFVTACNDNPTTLACGWVTSENPGTPYYFQPMVPGFPSPDIVNPGIGMGISFAGNPGVWDCELDPNNNQFLHFAAIEGVYNGFNFLSGGHESVGQVLNTPLISGQTYILEYFAAYSLNSLIPGIINPQINIFLEHDNTICDNSAPTSVNGGMVPTDPNAFQFNHIFNVGPQTWEHVSVCFTADDSFLQSLYITPGNTGFINALVDPNGYGYISYFIDEISLTAVTNDPISVIEMVVDETPIAIGDCETPICLFVGVDETTFNTFEVEWTIDLDDQPCTNPLGISLPIILDVILPLNPGITYLNNIGDSFDPNLQVIIPPGGLANGQTITLTATFQFNSNSIACQGIPIQLTLDPNSPGGCLVHDPFVNIIPSDMTLVGEVTTSVCYGGCIDLTSDCFVGPLTFSWADANGTVFSTDEDLCELEPGTYTVTVTDAFCDVETATYNVAFNSIMQITSLTSAPNCFNDCTGSITVTINPQIIPYTYTLNPGGVVVTTNNTSVTFNNLCPDVYSVNVQSGNLAECDVTGYIVAGGPLVSIDLANETCLGSCDGYAIPSVLGNAPFSYNWIDFGSPQNQDETQVDLCSGEYTLIVTDANSCTSTVSASVGTDIGLCCPEIVLDIEESPAFNYPGAAGGYLIEIFNPGPGDAIGYPLTYNLDPDFDLLSITYTDPLGNITSGYPSTVDIPEGGIATIQVFGYFNEAGWQPFTTTVSTPTEGPCENSWTSDLSVSIFIGCPADWTAATVNCDDTQCFTTCLHFFDSFPEDNNDYVDIINGVVHYDSGFLNFCGIVDIPDAVESAGIPISTGIPAPSGSDYWSVSYTANYNSAVSIQNGDFPTINDVVCLQFSLATIPPPTNYTQIENEINSLVVIDADGDNVGVGLPYSVNNIPTDGAEIYLIEETPGDCWLELMSPNSHFSLMPGELICDGTANVVAEENDGLHIWDFGDDQVGSVLWGTNFASYTYTQSGFYTISHTVIIDGWASVETFQVEVILSATHPSGYNANNGDTWSGMNYQLLQDLYVGAGVNMTISNSVLRFGPMAGIVIVPGGNLTIENCTLTDFVCEGTGWYGIDVRGNTSQPQTNTNQGSLRIDDSLIEHAYIAIRNYDRNDFSLNPTSAGGMITSVYTKFKNNQQGIRLRPYSLADSKVYIYNSTFITDEHYPYVPDDLAYVELNTVRGVLATGCSWINSNSGWFDNSATRPIIGIRANRSEFTLGPNCTGYPPYALVNCPTEHSYMEGLSYGVHAILSDLVIDQTEFHCFRGVYAESTKAMRVTRNEFHNLPTPLVGFDPIAEGYDESYHYGSYFDRCTGYWFEQNYYDLPDVPDWDGDGEGDDYGSVIRSSGAAYNLAYRNTYKNTLHGTYAKNINRGTNGNNGLKIECNHYENNHDDIAIWHDVPPNSNFGISLSQGFYNSFNQTGSTAGNLFIDNDSELEVKNGEGWVTYWTHNNENLVHWTNMTVNTFPNEELIHTCESHIPEDHQGHSAKMNSAQSNDLEASAVKVELLALVDDGDTEGLTEEVIYADFSEAVDLYYELMSKSPSLSESVMIEAIKKEADLPASLLSLILASNPTAAKSSEVQRAINERMIPLDEYQKMMIDQGLNLVSQKEQLESQLSFHESRADASVNEAICMMLQDETLTDCFTEAINAALSRSKLEFDLIAAQLHLMQGNANEAQSILDGIVNNYTFTNSESATFNGTISAMEIWGEIIQNNQLTLSENQIIQLETLAAIDADMGGGLAQSILDSYSEPGFNEPLSPMPPVIELRSVQEVIVYPNEKLVVYPNPAQDFVVVRLKGITSHGMHLQLYDSNGKLALSQPWPDMQSEMVVELHEFVSGTYTLRLVNSETVVQSLLLEVMR